MDDGRTCQYYSEVGFYNGVSYFTFSVGMMQVSPLCHLHHILSPKQKKGKFFYLLANPCTHHAGKPCRWTGDRHSWPYLQISARPVATRALYVLVHF